MFSYADIPDKSRAGLERELRNGLTVAAVYFQTTLGIPLEVFNTWLTEKLANRAEQWHWYMSFRNAHPKLYEEACTKAPPQ